MSLYLNAADRRYLAAAQRVMLAPLAYADLETWQLAVNRQIRDLVGADHLIAFVTDEHGFRYFSGDTETDSLSLLHDLFAGHDDAGFVRFKPLKEDLVGSLYIEQFHRYRRARGSAAHYDGQSDAALRMKRTDLFQSTFTRTHLTSMLGLSTPLPVGEFTTCIAFESPDAMGYSEKGLHKLELLVPAYEAGVRAWRRASGYRDALDDVGNALAVFGPEGEVLFESRGLGCLLSDESEADVVVEAMRQAARRLLPWRPRRRRKIAKQEPNSCEVTTERGTYRLLSSPLLPSTFGREAVLVVVEPNTPILPPPDEVREKFGLTPREAEVALLIAEGLDNRAVAGRLHISPHTARRHTERVLKKLDIASRAAVTISILGPVPVRAGESTAEDKERPAGCL